MPLYKTTSKQKYFSELINPLRVFLAILIAVIIWLYPVITPTQEKNQTLAVYAGGNYKLSCSYGCQVDVCTRWIPAGPGCSNPGEGGGCCTRWERQCGSDCEEDPPPNQPPAISHTFTCSQTGNNGWCVGNLTLNLTASDPQNAQVIISGDVSGVIFSCPVGNTNCSIPLSEGAGSVNYKVDSATGLSDNGIANYQLDSSTPFLNGSLSGVVGTNNWYKSNATLNVTASDSISGISSITVSIDGGAPSAVNSPITFTDGVHTVVLTTTDNAGHTTQITQLIQVDTITPSLNVSTSGTSGLNDWYVSNVTITPSASDTGSGLASLEISQDGSAYTNYQSPIAFTDGIHTYKFRAIDNAGNVTETTTQEIKVDTITPSLNISVSGTSGLNSWYVSTATVTPIASDSGSGLASLEVSQDSSAYTTYQSPIIFTDGVHTHQFKAIDNAGNITETVQQTIKVDTITPTISLNVTGELGTNPLTGSGWSGWYISDVIVTPVINDSTSGVSSLEAIADGNTSWAEVSELAFSDGLHDYQFRVIDNAGNSTTIPVQHLKVDTISPAIAMEEDEFALGETLYYSLEDNGSGLYIYRTVVEDDDEKYKKIVWLGALNGSKYKDEILWDGKFADGQQAGWGEYFITLKTSDAAGNETIRTAVVTVNLLSFLKDIPSFIPPLSTTQPVPAILTESASSTFGGENSNTTTNTDTTTSIIGGENNNNTTSAEVISTNEGGVTAFNSESDFVQFGFTQGNESTSTPISSSNILLGTLATVALGATLAEWQRRREEEEQRRREEVAAKNQRRREEQAEYDRINSAYQASLDAKKAAQQAASQQALEDFYAQEKGYAITQAEEARQKAEQQIASQKALEDFHAQEKGYANTQAEEAKKAGAQKVLTTPVLDNEKPKWWEKAIDWVDNNQTITSLGIGAIVGIAAIAITLAVVATVTLTVIATAAVLATVAAGVIVAAGTLALNSHYDRPPTTNLASNVLVAAATAFIVSGGALALIGACGNPVGAPVCTAVAPLLDTVELASLQVQLAYETAIGNPHAGETYIELQFEMNDGGVPGNTVAANLGGDVLELIEKYGDEVLPLVIKYGDDAVDIIGTYGDEGIALLTMYGDDAAKLINEYGTPAVDLMIKHGDNAVELIDKYGDDVFHVLNGEVVSVDLGNLDEFANDLTDMIGKKVWISPTTGVIYVSKSTDDALDASTMLKDAFAAGDEDEVAALVEIIAEGSTKGSGNHLILGAWQEGDGYIQGAVDNGGIFFDTGKDVWDQIEASGIDPWLVNEQFLKNQLESGVDRVDFLGDDIFDVINNPDPKISESFRAQEIDWLLQNAKDYGYELVGNSWILIKP